MTTPSEDMGEAGQALARGGAEAGRGLRGSLPGPHQHVPLLDYANDKRCQRLIFAQACRQAEDGAAGWPSRATWRRPSGTNWLGPAD